MESRWLDLGFRLHLADFGGEGPRTFVLVHGLGGSHCNWAAFGPLLARHGRVLAPDLPGFGRTPPLPGRAGLQSCLQSLEGLLGSLDSGPVTLVGNSLGGALSILLAGRRPELVERLVLLDPALPVAYGARVERKVLLRFALSMLPFLAHGLLRRHRLRVGPAALVRELLALTTADPKRIPATVVTLHEAMATERTQFPWIDRAMVETTRSLIWALTRRFSFFRAMRAVRVPTLLVHGERDRLIPLRSAEAAVRLCPSWQLATMPGVGHVPQMEAPEALLDLVLKWMAAPAPDPKAVRAS